MRMGFVKHKSIAPLLIAVSLAAAPGCKSGWKMPSPSGMWPWNRQPSAETLAGTPTKPTVESPAAKHTPNSVASVAAGSTKSASTAGAMGNTGFPQASFASTPIKPTNGGAASANGYQIGPYGMSGQAGTQPPAATNTVQPGSGQIPGSSYAGTAGLPSNTMQPSVTPNTTNPYAPNPVVSGGIAQTNTTPTLPGGTNLGYNGMPNASSQFGSSMPQYQPSLPAPTGPGTTSAVNYTINPPVGSAGSLPPSSYSQPTPPAGFTVPQMPPVPGASSGGPTSPVPPTTGDAYRPGSTGRTNNNYNFSTGNATVPVNSGSYTPSQPAAPASNSGYGNFNLPPNTANAGGQPVVR